MINLHNQRYFFNISEINKQVIYKIEITFFYQIIQWVINQRLIK